MPDNNLLLPYNREAEQSVLGSVLIDASCMSTALIHLKPDYFYLPEHRQIFSSMLVMYNEKNNAIDYVTIADALEKTGYTDARAYIYELAQMVPSTANVEKYAEIVKEQYYLRTLIGIAQQRVLGLSRRKSPS